MKRFIFTCLFALILGVGQTFAFDDVGEKQTVVTELSDSYYFETFEAREISADVLVVHATQSGEISSFGYTARPLSERMRKTPAVIKESKQEVVLAENLPPNYIRCI